MPYPGASVCPVMRVQLGMLHCAVCRRGNVTRQTMLRMARVPLLPEALPPCRAVQRDQRPVVAGTTTICDDNGHGVHTSLQHQPTFHHRGGISTTIDGDVAWAQRFTVAGHGLKVPLAPMPSRCKRARRVRVPVDSTSPTMGGDVGETGGCGPASSSSGSNCAPRAAEQSFIRPTTPRDQKPTLPANALSPARSNRAVQP